MSLQTAGAQHTVNGNWCRPKAFGHLNDLLSNTVINYQPAQWHQTALHHHSNLCLWVSGGLNLHKSWHNHTCPANKRPLFRDECPSPSKTLFWLYVDLSCLKIFHYMELSPMLVKGCKCWPLSREGSECDMEPRFLWAHLKDPPPPPPPPSPSLFFFIFFCNILKQKTSFFL